MGAGHMDMSRYMEMVMRHNDIHRVVEDIVHGHEKVPVCGQ